MTEEQKYQGIGLAQASRWPLEKLTNVGHVVSEAAKCMPESIAVAAPKSGQTHRPLQYDSITFHQLERRSNQIALGLAKMGARPGTRVALMVPPGIEFVSLVFGLFKAGLVVILIDPGMGRKNMLKCLSDASPEGIIGIKLAQMLRSLLFWKFPKCKFNVLADGSWWPGCVSLQSFGELNPDDFCPLIQTRETEAAIIFTTGSTGPPKGVLYRHRVFLEQARQIRDYFDIAPGSVDVSGFPLFALFNCGMGTTTVFPRMDATRPAEVDPLDIKDAVDKFNADQSFGSPALWNTVSRYAIEHDLSFPTIKKVFSAGAPVPPHVLERIRKIIAPEGDAYTPYGATESLPIACNSASVVLSETAKKTATGNGTCVGPKFPDIQWKVIRISDEPIDQIANIVELPVGEIGELIVKGPVVTDCYVTRTDANPYHKIIDQDSIWHRMGDVGYLDDQHRFWFCGRKSHRVITDKETLFTIVVEGIINTHPQVYRSALVGVGQRGSQVPVVIVELWPEYQSQSPSNLIREVQELCESHEKTLAIKNVLVKDKLPVDIRHNSKIFREQLVDWAAKQI